MVFKLIAKWKRILSKFENDVKMYGIQTSLSNFAKSSQFENDVKMYGIQTILLRFINAVQFENDVKMYGIQTKEEDRKKNARLRMM